MDKIITPWCNLCVEKCFLNYELSHLYNREHNPHVQARYYDESGMAENTFDELKLILMDGSAVFDGLFKL